MNASKRLLPLFIPGMALALGAQLDDTPAYGMSAGSTLERSFSSVAEYELDDLTITVDGEEMEIPDDLPGLSVEASELIVVTDTISDASEEGPLAFSRSYDTLENQTTFIPEEGDEEHEQIYASPLEGVTLEWTWDGDEEEWTIEAAEEDSVDSDLLDILAADMDLLGFLPDDEIEVGDHWAVSDDVWAPMMYPGGDLSFQMEGTDEKDPADGEITRGMIENLTAEGEATLEEIHEEDGARLAVIRFEISIASEVEIDVEVEDGPVAAATMGREMEREIEGELLWNLDEGHPQSLDAQADSTFVIVDWASIETDEVSFEQGRRQTFTGTVTYETRFAAGE